MIKSIGLFLRTLRINVKISDLLFTSFINITEAVKLPNDMLHELSKPEHIFLFEVSNLTKEFKLKYSIISCDIKSPAKLPESSRHCSLMSLSFRLTFPLEGAF